MHLSKLLITCGKLYEVEGDNSIELTRSWESSIDLVDMNCRLKGALLCQEFGEGGGLDPESSLEAKVTK